MILVYILYNIYMDKDIIFSIPKDVTHDRGYVYSLQYHIVWATKYRKPIFVGRIDVATVSDRSLRQVTDYINSQKMK